MRWLVVVLLMESCVRDLAAAAPPETCGSCRAQFEPHLGMSNYTRIGDCRYEVRKGDACCLLRWDHEPPRTHQPTHKTVAIEQPDGGFAVDVLPRIEEQTFQPDEVALCPGERFEVCGALFECAP